VGDDRGVANVAAEHGMLSFGTLVLRSGGVIFFS
jgi:hypothetical protein